MQNSIFGVSADLIGYLILLTFQSSLHCLYGFHHRLRFDVTLSSLKTCVKGGLLTPASMPGIGRQ